MRVDPASTGRSVKCSIRRRLDCIEGARVRNVNVRFVKVVCTHPRKPRARTHEFSEKLKLVWNLDHWGIDLPDASPLIFNFKEDMGIGFRRTRMHDDIVWTYAWRCPVCRFDLPLKRDTIVILISALDRIEHATTGHRHTVRLDISRAQQVLRCAGQAGSSAGKPRRPSRLTNSDAPIGRVKYERAPRSTVLATAEQGQT
jgi:hypothetical protein